MIPLRYWEHLDLFPNCCAFRWDSDKEIETYNELLLKVQAANLFKEGRITTLLFDPEPDFSCVYKGNFELPLLNTIQGEWCDG